MSRLAWTDPAPLEVERPRLPWWTLLPRRFLWAVSPIIAVVAMVMILVFAARRVWRYPLFLIGSSIVAGLGMNYSWWAPVWLVVGLGAASALWALAHRDSFERIAARQMRSEWRRALVYAWPWKRVLLFSDLTKHTGHRQRHTHYPTLRRVRSDGWRDRVSVKLLHGQCADTYAAHAQELANSFRARSCRVRVDKPRRIWLDFLHTETPSPSPSPFPPWPSRARWWIWRG
jgi:DNA segregation ATPase FtsK/SpoIIIE, S-DNA-T family